MRPFELRSPSDVKAFPMACLCGNGHGVLVDTFMDRNVIGRVYLCTRCLKSAAVAKGWLPGERADELTAAEELLASAQGQLGERDELIHQATNRERELETIVAGLEAQLAEAHARETQAATRLEQTIAATQATLEAVRGGAPDDRLVAADA